MPKANGYTTITTDEKIRVSLAGLADKVDEQIRDKILLTYKDRELHKAYQRIRDSGIYEKGHGKAKHRKIVEFPNPEVFDFVDKVLTAMYGDDWLYDNKALKHELVRPWWVIKTL